MRTQQPETKKIFIGVSWPYASAGLHLGHLAGQHASCDVFARYHRLKGNKVLMVSGSDCHGADVLVYAEEQGIEPKELAEKSHKEIIDTYKTLGLLYDNYTKTNTKNHKIVVHNLFKALYEFGYLKIKDSKQYYDTKVDRFLPDRYVRGTCPKCGATNARGTECPECGAFLSPTDLIDPYSILSDSTPIIKKTTHFYLDLTKAEPKLKKWLENKNNTGHWRKWVREFSKGFIETGLKPRAITRDLDYGIDIPIDGWNDKVIYVWFEAVIGYLSAAIEWAAKKGKPSQWETFWKDPNAKHYYFVAGGNVPFHTVIWPTEIMAYNKKYEKKDLFEKFKLPGEKLQKPLQLPFDVPANKMLLSGGKKMSKGDKTGIKLSDMMDYNPDLIRFFFIRYAPENHDREFVWKDFLEVNNNELVGILGNFVNRTLTFIESKYNGTVPKNTAKQEKLPHGNPDKNVQSIIDNAFQEIGNHIEQCEFVSASKSLLNFVRWGNKYFNDSKPWKTIKWDGANENDTKDNSNDLPSANECIYNCVQMISALSILMKPFMPFSAEKLRKMLNLPQEYDPNIELAETGEVSDNKRTDIWKPVIVRAGQKIGKVKLLFEKLDTE